MEDERCSNIDQPLLGHASDNTIAPPCKINMAAVYPLNGEAPPAKHTPKSSHGPLKLDNQDNSDDKGLTYFGISLLIFWYILMCTCSYFYHLYIPRCPIFHLHSLSVSPINALPSDSNVSAAWNVSFKVLNPNRFGEIIHEEAINVSVFYKEVNLSTATISPFYQLGKDERSLDAASVASVANQDILVADWSKNGGVMNFTVIIDDIVRIGVKTYHLDRRMNMRVACEDVKVLLFPSNTTADKSMLGDQSKQCKIQYSKELKYRPYSVTY